MRRYLYRIIQHKENGDKVGYKIKSYFGDPDGPRAALTSKPLYEEDIDAEEIETFEKSGFLGIGRKTTFTDEFKNEIEDKRGSVLKNELEFFSDKNGDEQ